MGCILVLASMSAQQDRGRLMKVPLDRGCGTTGATLHKELDRHSTLSVTVKALRHAVGRRGLRKNRQSHH